MTTLRNINITTQDTGAVDAFGRFRTSGTGNRFDVEFNYNIPSDSIDQVLNGAGAATHVANTRGVTLATGGSTTGDNAALYSYDIPYTPGNSQLIEATGTLDFASIGGGVAQVFLRTKVSGSVVETVVDQTSWNVDAASDVDWTTSQIFGIDFQSLKVGRIRFYLNRGGVNTILHEITNDNIRSTGYWQLPNQPVYWRIYNDATYSYMEVGYGDTDNAIGFRYRIGVNASATMSAICATVKSEGGKDLYEMPGYSRNISNEVTGKTASTTLIPIITIKPKTLYNSITNKGIVIPKSISISTDNPILLKVVHGGTLTGASYADVDATNSMVEYDITATAISGGHVHYSEYLATDKNIGFSSSSGLGKSVLWNRRGAENGILTICAVRTSSTNATVLASINWEEII